MYILSAFKAETCDWHLLSYVQVVLKLNNSIVNEGSASNASNTDDPNTNKKFVPHPANQTPVHLHLDKSLVCRKLWPHAHSTQAYVIEQACPKHQHAPS